MEGADRGRVMLDPVWWDHHSSFIMMHDRGTRVQMWQLRLWMGSCNGALSFSVLMLGLDVDLIPLAFDRQ